MGYYVLSSAVPPQIPSFQYHLDVNRGVGRLHFDRLRTTPATPARSSSAESGRVKLPRRLVIFGPQNEDDDATDLSSRYLIRPMLPKLLKNRHLSTWAPGLPGASSPSSTGDIQAVLGDEAKKGAVELSRRLGDASPALHRKTHGAEFPWRLASLPHQGRWSVQGLAGAGGPSRQHPARLLRRWRRHRGRRWALGLITYHFACFGGGSPAWTSSRRRAAPARLRRSPQGLSLPSLRRLLCHPRGGSVCDDRARRAHLGLFVPLAQWPDADRDVRERAFAASRACRSAG